MRKAMIDSQSGAALTTFFFQKETNFFFFTTLIPTHGGLKNIIFDFFFLTWCLIHLPSIGPKSTKKHLLGHISSF
jgi:hypothetical protein